MAWLRGQEASMLQRVIPVGNDLVPESLSFDGPGNLVWAVTLSGEIVTVRLLDRRVELVGAGYQRPVAVIRNHDGLTLAVVEQDGSTLLAARSGAARNRAAVLADLPGQALAARRHVDVGSVLVLTTHHAEDGPPDPTIFRVHLQDGTSTIVASGLAHARTFVVDEGRRELVVLTVTPNGDRQLLAVGLDDGVVTPGPQVPFPFSTIVTPPNVADHGVIGGAIDQPVPGQGELALMRLDGTAGPALSLDRSVLGLTRWGSLIVGAAGSDLIAVDWDLDEGVLPVDAPLGPLFVNGYARVPVDLASAGLTPGEVKFAVREGPEAGSVSAGIEPPSADGSHRVMLLGGIRPGEYHLEARLIADDSLLATRRFRVTASWPDEVTGPPIAMTGPQQRLQLMSWGGAGASASYIKPAPEHLNVAVVLVSTSDRRWDSTLVPALIAWENRLIGATNSAKQFYEEVSYRNTAGAAGDHVGMSIRLAGNRVLGPVNLEEGWGDLFKLKEGTGDNRGWLTTSTGKEIIGNAISAWLADQPDGTQILSLADAMVVIIRSGSDTPTTIPSVPLMIIPTRYVWGHAPSVNFWRKTVTTFTQGPKPVTFMTDAYPASMPNLPSLLGTLCHELGHNLGLDDLYDAQNDFPAEINARIPKKADLMASSKPLPHFSIGNRMRLGWIKPSWLRRFDFSASPTGGTVMLHAAEALARSGAPAGRFAGIEVPISDGWSYLFELRRTQPSQVGDQQITSLGVGGNFVLGTDLRVSAGESKRPPILFLPNDIDGDGPVLDTAAENYEDSDTTNPIRMHDFRLTLQSLGIPDADCAQVQVEYVQAHRPQLQIRPAPGDGNFKSPDIELVGPFGMALAVAIKGMPNVIRVTVHNHGTLEATEVQAHVSWLPYTVSAGAWQPLSDPPRFTVPAKGKATFQIPWVIPASVKVGDVEATHFCVRVTIDRYFDPVHPDQGEIVVFDNWAQSNFDNVSVPFGSPSERMSTVATATNSLERAATYLFTVDQSGEGYRVYVGHAWLRLGSGVTHAMELAYESLSDDPVHGVEFERHLERITSQVNHVAVSSWLVPENTECDTPREWWGVSLDMRAGRRAWIEEISRNGELVTARIRSRSGGNRIDVLHGDVYLAAWPEEDPLKVSVTQGTIDPDGIWRLLLSNEALYYLGAGSRVIAALARTEDAKYARVISKPFPLS